MSKQTKKPQSKINATTTKKDTNTWCEYLNAAALPPVRECPDLFRTSDPVLLRTTYANWKKDEHGFPIIFVKYRVDTKNGSNVTSLRPLDEIWLEYFQRDLDLSKLQHVKNDPKSIPFDPQDQNRRPILDIRYFTAPKASKKTEQQPVPKKQETKTEKVVEQQENDFNSFAKLKGTKTYEKVKSEVNADVEIDEETKQNDSKFSKSFTPNGPDSITPQCFLSINDLQTIINYDEKNMIAKGTFSLQKDLEEKVKQKVEDEPGTIIIKNDQVVQKQEPIQKEKKKKPAKATVASPKKTKEEPKKVKNETTKKEEPKKVKEEPNKSKEETKKVKEEPKKPKEEIKTIEHNMVIEKNETTKEDVHSFFLNHSVKFFPDIQALSWVLPKIIRKEPQNGAAIERIKSNTTLDYLTLVYPEDEKVERMLTSLFLIFKPTIRTRELKNSEISLFTQKGSFFYDQNIDMVTFISPTNHCNFSIDWDLVHSLFYITCGGATSKILELLNDNNSDTMKQFTTMSTEEWLQKDPQVVSDLIFSVLVKKSE